MKKEPSQQRMSDLLRQALLECESLREVERQTGVLRQTLSLFRQGKQSLRLDKADLVAQYFEIECRRKEK